MEECRNKLKTYAIPKNYLTIKPSEFSYKLYINLCYYGFWNHFMDGRKNERIEYYILDFTYKALSDHLKNIGYSISRQKIQKEIENNKVYRLKDIEVCEEVIGKNLSWNSPVDNYTILNKEALALLNTEEEMSIRFYTLLQGWKYDSMTGIPREEILSMIGYGSSGKNLSKLSECTKRLKELNLISYKKYTNGQGKTYMIYYKE